MRDKQNYISLVSQVKKEARYARDDRGQSHHGNRSTNIMLAEVINPSEYGFSYIPSGHVYCRVLSGPYFDPLDEFRFMAQISPNEVFAFGDKVFVLDSESYPYLVLGGFVTSVGSSSTLLPPHSHSGFYDGGYAGFLSGTR